MKKIWTISHCLIAMVNVVLDLKCLRLKYMLETINYNKVDPVI